MLKQQEAQIHQKMTKPKGIRTIVARCLIYAFATAASFTHAFGQVVIQHYGANDPLTQGFTLVDRANAAVGPVFDDLGFDAWSINPRSGNEVGGYYYTLTPADQQAAISQGWVLSARVRLLDQGESGIHTFRFDTGTAMFAINLSAQANGDVNVFATGLHMDPYTLEGGSGAYHEYVIAYDAVSERSALWIDGIERRTGLISGSISTSPIVSFGSGQNIAHAHWNEVTLTIIPEPATIALLTGGAALLITGLLRWRRRRGLL